MNAKIINFFLNGETEIIGDGFNIKAPTESLLSASLVIADVLANKPATSAADDGKYNYISIRNNEHVIYESKTQAQMYHFTIAENVLNQDNIRALLTEADSFNSKANNSESAGLTWGVTTSESDEKGTEGTNEVPAEIPAEAIVDETATETTLNLDANTESNLTAGTPTETTEVPNEIPAETETENTNPPTETETIVGDETPSTDAAIVPDATTDIPAVSETPKEEGGI